MTVGIFIGVVGLAMTKAGSLENLADSETVIVRITGLIKQAWCTCGTYSRCYPCRNIGSDNVNLRQPASYGSIGRIAEYTS